jgi:hypothetical protein
MENTSSVVEATSTELPPTDEVPPSYITTLDELLNTHGAIIQKENTDRISLLSVFQPNAETLRTRLFIWASQGFPANWKVSSTQITAPTVCSDGERRQVYNYTLYLLNNQIESFLNTLNSQVPGIKFSFFSSDTNTIGLSIIKA